MSSRDRKKKLKKSLPKTEELLKGFLRAEDLENVLSSGLPGKEVL